MRHERSFLLKKNTISGIAYQLVVIVSGFVLPKAILVYYGSEVNGVINSISQLLQVISFLELGVGTVIQSSLYRPIADNNIEAINQIISAGNSFFKKIAFILVLYVIALIFFFPLVIDRSHSFIYDCSLIVALSSTMFMQYYFGIVDYLFLNAHQEGYIHTEINIVAYVISTIVGYILIVKGNSVQLVKIVTALVFLIRPIIVRIYVNQKYHVNRKAKFSSNILQQKWYGLAQHIAAIVLDGTDVIVLSICSTMENVSIYSVYNMVVYGIRSLFQYAYSGVAPLFGNLWANNEKKQLVCYFEKIEILTHALVLLIWGCTYKLLLPFVLVYTKGINDVNYNVPLFAEMICFAGAISCLRITSLYLVFAVDRYKQTQYIFVISAVINLSISFWLVSKAGLIGVALGTVTGMLYQTLSIQSYCIRDIGISSYHQMAKQWGVDGIIIILIGVMTNKMHIYSLTFTSWLWLAIKVFFVILSIVLFINVIVNGKRLLNNLNKEH